MARGPEYWVRCVPCWNAGWDTRGRVPFDKKHGIDMYVTTSGWAVCTKHEEARNPSKTDGVAPTPFIPETSTQVVIVDDDWTTDD